MTALAVHAADRTQWPAALEVLFHQLDPAARHASEIRTEALLRACELDPQGLFVAESSGRIVGALLCMPAAGAVALVWPPQVLPAHEKTSIEDALIRAALSWLKSKGVKLAQVLSPPEEAAQAAPLLRHGFERVTTLIYLRHQLSEPIEPASTDLRFDSYASSNVSEFAATLAETYEGTLDCPEVNDARSMDEVLAGHRAQGVFAPEQWWLVYPSSSSPLSPLGRGAGGEGSSGDSNPPPRPSPQRGEGEGAPLGVLLVNALSEEPGWEIIYMGIVPGARGRGLGRQLTRHALATGQAAGVQHVDLCVDCRNFFARHVYESLGFTPFAERVVVLARLDG